MSSRREDSEPGRDVPSVLFVLGFWLVMLKMYSVNPLGSLFS